MAQTTTSKTKSPGGRNGDRQKRRSSRTSARPNRSSTSAQSKRSTAKAASESTPKRSRSKGNRARRPSTARSRPQSRSTTASSPTATAAVKDRALDRTKAAGHAVADAASKAKTPLIAGGTALAGAAAGAVVRGRLAGKRSKGPLKRLRGKRMPKLDLGRLDLDTFKSTAERVTAYGQQASDVAAAVEKTRKKHK